METVFSRNLELNNLESKSLNKFGHHLLGSWASQLVAHHFLGRCVLFFGFLFTIM